MDVTNSIPQTKNGIPILKGTLSPNGTSIYIQCPHCKKQHSHGYTGDNFIHRVAHCWKPDSPFEHTGYYIEAVK